MNDQHTFLSHIGLDSDDCELKVNHQAITVEFLVRNGLIPIQYAKTRSVEGYFFWSRIMIRRYK